MRRLRVKRATRARAVRNMFASRWWVEVPSNSTFRMIIAGRAVASGVIALGFGFYQNHPRIDTRIAILHRGAKSTHYSRPPTGFTANVNASHDTNPGSGRIARSVRGRSSIVNRG